MIELLWRWLHHTVAPHRRTQWFRRAVLAMVAVVSAIAVGVLTLVIGADSVRSIPPPMALPVFVASMTAASSFGWVVTAFASVRFDSGDVLTPFPLARTRRRIVLQVHTLVVQGVLALLVVPPACWAIQHLTGVTWTHAVTVSLAAVVAGAAVGSVISLGAALVAFRMGSPSTYVGIASVAWVLWFLLSGAAGRALLDGQYTWWMVPTGWALLTPDPSPTAVATMVLVFGVSLSVIPVAMAYFPEFPTTSHALIQFSFTRLPTFCSMAVRSARNSQVRAQVTAGIALTSTLGAVLVWREGIQSQGLLAVFGSLFCSAIAAQSRLIEGPVRRDWIAGLSPRQTIVPGLAAAGLMASPVTVATVAFSGAEEGVLAAFAAGLLSIIGTVAGYSVATMLKPAQSHGTAELAIAVLSLSCLAGVLFVAPFSSDGNPELWFLATASAVSLAVGLILCAVWDRATWSQARR